MADSVSMVPSLSPDARRARDIVLQHGWNATAYQILNPDLDLWFARDGDAVIGFVRRGRVCIVAGAPVCDRRRLPAVVTEWEAWAARQHWRVCYFGAGERLESVLRRPGYAKVLLGAQPMWNPHDWPSILAARSSLRAQIKRAANKGVAVSMWTNAQVQNSIDLRRCLRDWLARRGLPAMHFLVEPHLLDSLLDRRVLVAERDKVPVGFAVLAPVPQRNGWLIEQIVRGDGAPNGTAEILVDAAFGLSRDDHCDYITLGLTPLSRRAESVTDVRHPLWLMWVLRCLRAHCRRFYNFDGIDAFKSKFAPAAWEPIYAISNEPHFSPLTLRAIAAAFSSGSPELLMLRALLNAAQHETTTARQSASKYFEAAKQNATHSVNEN